MLILAGVSINAVVGDNGILGKAQDSVYLQSIAVLQEYLQMEYSNYALDDNPYGTSYGLLNAKHPGWFYQNAQGYILDSEGHVLYLIKKSGLPEEIRKQIKGGDANKVSQYYKQKDVYGVTSDLQVYYCPNGTSTIMGLTTEDLDKDNPLEIAYDEDSLLAKIINGVGEDGKATEALSTQDLKSIKTLTIDTTEKLALLQEFKKLPSLQTVYFANITIPTLEGMQYATNITGVRFTSCAVQDYSALCSLSKLNKLYLITPTGKNTDVATLCSSDKGIATAEFSNLKYFGIVGNGTYLQSTEYTYERTRYDITDISGLSNLSTTTKQSIQYMYLQNLQLTSIASLSDYINITILRLEENAITTFNGIQNMSKLAYLIAPTCYSSTTSAYTVGKDETDTQNTSTDALSYIYKNEEGANTSLYYLDIRNAQNLKWTSYLSSCSGIRYLYMDNNTAIKDISTIANVIGNCGVNYKVPSQYTSSVMANNSKMLDLRDTTINETDFRKLKNNTNLEYLSLRNTVITKSTGETFSDDEYTLLLNEILSTCTNMKYLQLFGQTKLKNINFISNMDNLKELDLYGCSQVNDVSILETMSNNNSNFKLGTLNLSNTNIDLTKIQNTISRLGDTGTYWYKATNGGTYFVGLGIGNITLANKLSECTLISRLIMRRDTSKNSKYTSNFTGIIDLSNCTNLTYVRTYYTKFSFKLPSGLTEYVTGMNSVACDLSNCTNLKIVKFVDTVPNVDLNSTMSSIPNTITTLNKLTFSLKSDTYTNIDWCQNYQNCNNLTEFYLEEHNDNTNLKISDLSGLKYLKNLTSITLKFAKGNGIEDGVCADIPNLSGLTNLKTFYISYGCNPDLSGLKDCVSLQTLTIRGQSIKNINNLSKLVNLTSLDLYNNQITDISAIENYENLSYLYLNNNKVNNIKPLENLKKLQTIYLENNALYDSSYDSTGKPYYTLTVFADLNQKQDGSLKKLYLSGNNIEDFSMLQDSNLKWDAKSGW